MTTGVIMARLRNETKYPLLRAARWEFGRAFAGSSAGALLLACLAGAGVALVGFWSVIRPVLVSHLLTVSVLLALQASLLARAGRRKWTDHYSTGWLGTIPASRRAVGGMIALRAFLPPLLVFALAALMVWVAERVTQSGDFARTFWLAGTVATLGGGLLGWMLPRPPGEMGRDLAMGSLPAARPGMPQLAILSRWPIRQAREWLQPRSLARLLLPAILLLPMDLSANLAAAVVTLWAIALYLAALLRATIRVARDGATWLAPTPIRAYRFAWAAMRHPLLKQLQWVILAAMLLVALGCEPLIAARVAEWWLSMAGLVSCIAVTRGRRSNRRVKIVASISVLLISAWCLRKAVRA